MSGTAQPRNEIPIFIYRMVHTINQSLRYKNIAGNKKKKEKKEKSRMTDIHLGSEKSMQHTETRGGETCDCIDRTR